MVHNTTCWHHKFGEGWSPSPGKILPSLMSSDIYFGWPQEGSLKLYRITAGNGNRTGTECESVTQGKGLEHFIDQEHLST